ncbi:MAG TPA: baseplate protein [Buttiauxella sp.]|jgi:hypothetical protein
MSGHFNARGDMGMLKQNYNRNKAAGEKLMGYEFEVSFAGYPELTVLVRTMQIPERSRENVEDNGPSGLKFSQYGALKNNGEIQLQCVDTLQGAVSAMIVKCVQERKYIDITLKATPESLSGLTPPAHKTELSDCMIACDQVDFSTEDTAVLVKPSLRITYNFWS